VPGSEKSSYDEHHNHPRRDIIHINDGGNALQDSRDFLKTAALIASVLVVDSTTRALAADPAFTLNIIYTKDKPGKWASKGGSHAPEVTVNGSTGKVVTKHPMAKELFIVRPTRPTRLHREQPRFFTSEQEHTMGGSISPLP
jgi:hypothetical protein